MKVKILILIEPAPYVLDFIKILGANNRDDILILFARNETSQPWRKDASNLSSNISFLPNNKIRAMLLLWRLIRRDKTELLHTAGWHGFAMLFSWGIARIKKVPLFVELDTSRDNRSGLKSQIKNRIYQFLYSVPTCLLPAGTRGRDYLLDYGVEKSRIVTHQMTVDVLGMMKTIDMLRESAVTDTNNNICRFLFVGRLIKRKGLSSLLKAFGAVVASNNQCQLAIVGDGEWKSEVLAATQNVRNISYCGHLEGTALLRQYALADIFVFPAYDEPWGLVVNEAMAASLPVIVGEGVGCTDDLVKQGVNGFLVPADDYVALSEKMLALAVSSGLRKSMGQAGRKMIMDWTMEDQVRIIEDTWTKYAMTSLAGD